MPRDAITLADVRAPTLTIICEPCGRRGRYSVERLIAAHGADAKLPDLLVTPANCEKTQSFNVYNRCKARQLWSNRAIVALNAVLGMISRQERPS
jgi:hypothetical protein